MATRSIAWAITGIVLWTVGGIPSWADEKSTPADDRGIQNVIVFKEPGRYGGWPANHGVWGWGDEIVVGFTMAWYKPVTGGHAVDFKKPFEKRLARSRDGGLTWMIEQPSVWADPTDGKNARPLAEPLDFTHPDFAFAFAYGNQNVGPSWFYASTDRCHTWRGPFAFAVEGVEQISTRTDYIVEDSRKCLMFGSRAKADNKEGVPFCAATTDGGVTWTLQGQIGPEPAGYAIMPSSLRLKDGDLLSMIRHSPPKGPATIDAWLSPDNGKTWTILGDPPVKLASNPPSMVRLPDSRIVLTYGYRHKPVGIRARVSSDEGRTWGAEIILRDDALTGDLGYPRSYARPDGKVVTIYYYNGPRDEDRAIEATVWKP